jgi:phosphonate transport system permease protein
MGGAIKGRPSPFAASLVVSPMRASIPQLPEAQLAPLMRAYRASIAARRVQVLVGAAVLAVAIVVAAIAGEVHFGKLHENLWRFPNYFYNTIPKLSFATLWIDLADWFWGLKRWLRLLAETLTIAYLGTLTGALGAFVLCFLASANLGRSFATVFFTRRILEFCRTVPDIVFALLFVVAFGLGALPGVLAITLHTFGALGKLFAEIVENADVHPFEGVMATGSTWTEAVRFGIVPQVLPGFASVALLRFEINVRGAAVMGFVGAGGIGQDLIEAIRKFYYTDVSAILLLIIATVMLIDLLTERLRQRLTHGEATS